MKVKLLGVAIEVKVMLEPTGLRSDRTCVYTCDDGNMFTDLRFLHMFFQALLSSTNDYHFSCTWSWTHPISNTHVSTSVKTRLCPIAAIDVPKSGFICTQCDRTLFVSTVRSRRSIAKFIVSIGCSSPPDSGFAVWLWPATTPAPLTLRCTLALRCTLSVCWIPSRTKSSSASGASHSPTAPYRPTSTR